jgi:hypothetical protein
LSEVGFGVQFRRGVGVVRGVQVVGVRQVGVVGGGFVVAFLGVLGGVVVVLRRVFVVLGGVQMVVVGGFVFHGLVFLCYVRTA